VIIVFVIDNKAITTLHNLMGCDDTLLYIIKILKMGETLFGQKYKSKCIPQDGNSM
jgi:hypothetical protein